VSTEILARNVAALLKRSYAPALPTPLFRDKLAQRFGAELARRRRPRRTLPRLAVALAAALVLVFAALRAFAPDAVPTRVELVAAGEVALELADGVWRAADAEEREHGLAFVPPHLAVVTPAARGFDVLCAPGRLALAPASELRVLSEPGPLRAELVAGRATFHSRAGARALEIGRHFVLADAGVELAGTGPERPAERETAAVDAVEPAPEARELRGRVRASEDGASVTRFTVGLLRERTGNATYPPVTRAFESADGAFLWPDPPRGKQRVYVHAEGFALAPLGEFTLDATQTLEVRLERGVELAGTVRDEQGNPIAGALVIAEDEAPTDGLFFARSEDAFWLPVQTRSGADGRFTLAHAGVSALGSVLRTSADGYAPSWRKNARPGEELEVVLRSGGTLEGRVTGIDGSPSAGAQIVVVAMEQPTLPRTNFALATTDLEGNYEVEHLPPLTMIAVLMREGDRPDVRPLQMVEGTRVRADFALASSGVTLRGTMLGPDGDPRALQNVGLFERSSATWNRDWIASTTGRDGGFLFESLAPGRYLVFLIDELGRHLRCVDEFELGSELFLVERDIRVPASELLVHLRHADGAPVTEAAVVLERLEVDGDDSFAALGLSGIDGSFRFVEQRPGRYRLSAYPSDGRTGFATHELVELGATPAELTLTHGPGGAALVTVHSADGRPLARATVLFVTDDGREHSFSQVPETDSDGRFRALGLAPGHYTVRVNCEGYESTSVRLDSTPGAEALLPITLRARPAR
jgi:hypothetical protein